MKKNVSKKQVAKAFVGLTSTVISSATMLQHYQEALRQQELLLQQELLHQQELLRQQEQSCREQLVDSCPNPTNPDPICQEHALRWEQGPALVKCTPLHKLTPKDFEPGSSYLNACNGAIAARQGPYIVINPEAQPYLIMGEQHQDHLLMEEQHYDACINPGNGLIHCSRLENNRAITMCMWDKDKHIVVCDQFALTGKPRNHITIKADKMVVDQNGAVLSNPTCMANEPAILEELTTLIQLPWGTHPWEKFAWYSGDNFIEITHDNAPALHALIRNECNKIPALQDKALFFWIKNDANDDAAAIYPNIFLNKGKIDAVINKQITLSSLVSVLDHEIGHLNQDVSGVSEVIPQMPLNQSQVIEFTRLANLEAHADLHSAIMSDDAYAAGTSGLDYRPEYQGQVLTCTKQAVFLNGRPQQPIQEVELLQSAQDEFPGESLASQLADRHPECLQERIPAMMEVAEVKEKFVAHAKSLLH